MEILIQGRLPDSDNTTLDYHVLLAGEVFVYEVTKIRRMLYRTVGRHDAMERLFSIYVPVLSI